MATPTTTMSDEQLKALLAQFAQLMQQQQLVTLGSQGQADPYKNAGFFQGPVAGPAEGNQVARSYAPSGVIFGGGSPFPVDPGPARLQNTLVGIRDLISATNALSNSPIGAKLKGLLGGS